MTPTTSAIGLYLWAAFLVAMLAPNVPGAPKNQFALVFGSILLGLIWPVSLLAFVIEFPKHLTRSDA